ncbi:MAG: recombinase RecA [Methylococcaceae bacterium]|nr:recombinase RecA [Methylococcaceae bacterium]
MIEHAPVSSRISSGVAGLDELLGGGFIPLRAYLVRGGPGSGKTTLGLHFLTASANPALFITLSEDEASIRRNAETLGIDLSKVHIINLAPDKDSFFEEDSYDIFSPAEVERKPLADKLVSGVERIKPQRVFIDSLTQFRYLSADRFQFRKQTLSLFSYLKNLNITTLFSTESSAEAPDDDLQFLSDGIIEIGSRSDGRMLRITKFRGSDFAQDWHFFRLTDRGWHVFPRMRATEHVREFQPETVRSGVPELDELLHGGLARGTVTVISGPTGVGKTTLGLQYMKEAAGRGERSVIFTFEETLGTLFHRARAIGVPIDAMVRQGTLAVHYVEPLIYSAFEFAAMLREEAECRDARIVMLDSSKGFQMSIRGEDILTHLHTKCTYLKNMGVTTILVSELDTITGDQFKATEVGVSYLADTIVFLRYMELEGELRKAIGVLKNRTSAFERNLRELEITPYGIKVGRPLAQVSGILTGKPTLRRDSPA